MKKIALTLFLVFNLLCAAFASDRNPDYVYTSYGELVRGAYGNCIHTAFYKDEDGLSECGESPVVGQIPESAS